MHVFQINQILQNEFVENMIRDKQDTGHCKLVFENKDTITMGTRIMLLHALLWKPYHVYNITPSKDDIYNLDKITGSTLSDIQSIIYDKLLKGNPDVYYIDIVFILFDMVGEFVTFVSRYARAYAATLDMVGLCKMRQNPEIVKIINTKLDSKQGTAVAEAMFKMLSDEFSALISEKGRISNNVLYDFAITNTLSKNQLPQLFIAYCARSDIDDIMMKHIINESSISGLKSIADFGVESLSVKKSSHSSKKTIKQSQYFARKLKLASTPLKHIYTGSCGNTRTLPIVLHKKYKNHFLNKVIYDNKVRVELTEHNIDKYLDTTIHMMSPLLCYHTDGLCETCAGIGSDDFSKYNPPDIHIGIYAASMVASAVSQMILSAKHLIRTSSLVLLLPDNATRYMANIQEHIKLTISKEDSEQLHIRMPIKDMGPLADLKHADIKAKSYSKVRELEIIKDDMVIEEIDFVEKEHYMLYLSDNFLKHMRKNLKHIKIENSYADIPLKGFNTNEPFITHITHNNDMRRFTKRVFTFLGTDVAKYSSISKCLQDFLSVLYDKTGINVLFVEILFKAFLIQKDGRVNIQ